MRNFLIFAAVAVFGYAALAVAQSAPASNSQVMGRGRGGAPYAWNDKNKDGICDLTGAPVGQGPCGAGMRRGRRGRWAGGGWGRGMGRGFGFQQRQQQQPTQAPAAPAQK